MSTHYHFCIRCVSASILVLSPLCLDEAVADKRSAGLVAAIQSIKNE
jgi:hypothetical protein